MTKHPIHPNGLPFQYCVFSSHGLWKHFKIEKYHFSTTGLRAALAKDHTLIFNTSNPVAFLRYADGAKKRFLCDHAQIAELASPQEQEEITPEQEFSALKLSFDVDFINKYLEMNNFRFKTQVCITDPALSAILFKIHDAINKDYISEKIYTESLIISCLIHLVTNYPANGKRMFAPKGKLSSRQLNQLIEYTRTFIHTNISLAQLASCVHLSPFHFARLFRHTIGISPYQFVLQLKIDYAKNLIRQNHGTLSDVAYALNFTDQAHFSNAFKKIAGICPREFIQSNGLRTVPVKR